MAKVEAAHLTRQFLRKRSESNVFDAVDDVSLSLEGGCAYVVSGPSGSGKTTLLNMLAGLLRPTSGTVCVDGQDLYALDDEAQSAFRNAHIGVVPQGQSVLPSLTAMENALVPALVGKGADVAAAHERAEELFGRVGIADLADVAPKEMSGGELRRVAVVRGMLMRPDVLLADEPTADLDAESAGAVLALLREAAGEGSAVLVVTHDRDVIAWADVALTLAEGKLSGQEGPAPRSDAER